MFSQPQPALQGCGCVFLTLMMKKITAIEAQKKNPGRVNIYLDDAFAFGLSRIVAAWLQVGQTLSEEKIAQLQSDDSREVGLQKALNFLSFRARSVHEVRQNLIKHEFSGSVIEEIIQTLERAGYLNDKDFAKNWVENRNTFRPRSKRALRMELRNKGLSEEDYQPVLEEDVDEDALALQAARKHFRRLSGYEWQDFRNKMSGFLGRKGFSYGVVAPVVRQVWEENQPTDQPSTNLDDEETL